MKHNYQCVVANTGRTFVFDLDEALTRGGIFRHAGRWYRIVDGPQPGVARSLVSVRRLT